MIEFLVRNRDDHGWPSVHRDRLAEVLTPAGWTCEAAPGWGHHRLRCGDTVVEFSGEPVGWQVSFEGPMPEDEATRFVAAVVAQLEREIGEPIEAIQIS
ncbi:hypothetical protein [Actinoplanes ianthinogenes]|nr:hypothetical protein [Actinoplanes ianthinogenes]